MTGSLHPALILLGAGLLIPFLRGRPRQALLLLAPLLGLANLLGFEAGQTSELTLAGFELQPLRVDKLSLLFGYLFHIAAFLASIYSLHISGKDRGQHLSGLVYAASAVGTVFAGDLLTLFVFW
ncbi:MAG: Na(+)/H(+) antiporter subunit D, partial [Planctomycetota bacterium]|nr:Na(+)/H(+) antiporter subunit D [Planctomycetota bacterium]